MFERRDGTRMTARIVTAQHDVGTCAFADALDSQPLTGAPGGGVQDRRRRKAGVVEFHHFVRNPAVFDHAAGVGTGIDGNPPASKASSTRSRRRSQRRIMWSAYSGNFGAAWAAISGKVAMLTRVGDDGTDCSTKRGKVPRKEAGGVLYAVDIGVEHVIDGVLAETMRGDPCSLIVGRGNGFLDGLRGGNEAARSPTLRSIQSPTSFTQPSPSRASFRTVSTSSRGSIS